MAEFLTAYKIVSRIEGGYVNDPDDTGGETYAGISRNNFPKWGGWKIVDSNKPLKKYAVINDAELASLIKQFYKVNFWDNIKGDLITSQKVATFIYDWFVNSGSRAIKKVQKLIGVVPDGNFGNKTIQAVNSMPETELLEKLKAERILFYNNIVAANPSQKKFLDGWLGRVEELT